MFRYVCAAIAALTSVAYATPRDLTATNVTYSASNATSLGDSISYWGYEAILSDQKGSNNIGGSGGTFFEFHTYGTTVKDITVWGGGADGGFHAIEIVLFNGDRKVYGHTSGNSIGSFTFNQGESLTGNLILSGNGVGTRTGYLAFTTNQGRSFSAGNSGHDHYYYYAEGRLITGFFGRSGSDVDALGVVFSKPIARVELQNVNYPSLDLTNKICNPPNSLYAADYQNPNPVGTKANVYTVSFSKEIGTNDCWDLSSSLSFGQSYTVSGGIPDVVSVSDTFHWKVTTTAGVNGCSSSKTTSSETTNVSIAPQESCHISITQCVGTLDKISYTATLRLHFTDGSTYDMASNGSYNGARTMLVDVEPQCEPL